MSAKLMQAIVTGASRGQGVAGDPYRTVTQYFDTDGNFLAEWDPCAGQTQLERESRIEVERDEAMRNEAKVKAELTALSVKLTRTERSLAQVFEDHGLAEDRIRELTETTVRYRAGLDQVMAHLKGPGRRVRGTSFMLRILARALKGEQTSILGRPGESAGGAGVSSGPGGFDGRAGA